MTNNDSLLRPPPNGVEQRPVTTASRLLMGGPVVLVTSSWRGRHNVMPLAWHMPVSSDPPLIAIAIERSRYSVDVISHAQEFALNFPARPLIHHVQYLGSLTGEQVDKFEATQLETFSPTHVTAPLIVGCTGWIECEVQDALPFGDHTLFIGLAVAVHVDPASFGDRWLLSDDEDTRPLHFLGGNYYSTLHRLLEAKLPRNYEAPERVLRERMAEELELTRESRERRDERKAELERDVERGNVVDVAELGGGRESGVDEVDLSKGIVLGGAPETPGQPTGSRPQPQRTE